MPASPASTTGSNSPPDLVLDIDDVENDDHSSHEESPSLEELRPNEFPSYFTQRKGRLFHRGSSSYPLPVDTPEQERQTMLHETLHRFHGAHYVGPVQEFLTPNPRRELTVLDVCTGNGRWVLDMAAEFPQVYFIGFDHVPIATRYPPENVRFEIQDVNTAMRWSDQTFDIVHLRAVSLAVRNFGALLQEITRVARPGGLLISSEWDHDICFDPSSGLSDISTHAPAACQFFNAVNTTLRERFGLNLTTPQIGQMLNQSGEWVDISTARHHVPISAHPSDSAGSVGELNLAAHERYIASIRHVLEDTGNWTEGDLDMMTSQYVEELQSRNGLASVLHTVHARRI